MNIYKYDEWGETGNRQADPRGSQLIYWRVTQGTHTHTHTDTYTHNEGEQQQRERHGDTADKGKEINAQLET